jgi:hypothetical protein
MIKIVKKIKKFQNLTFLKIFEYHGFAGVAPENQYLGIDSMDFGPSTCFGNIIKFYLDLQSTKS